MNIEKQISKIKKHSSEVNCLLILAAILIVAFYFCKEINYSFAEKVIFLVVFLIFLFLLSIFLFAKISFFKFAFIFFLLAGGMLVFIQPILNAPDEVAHLARAEIVSRGNFIVEFDEQYHETIKSITNLADNSKIPYTQSSIKGDEIDYSHVIVTHIATTNLSIFYIPQALGILFAKVLGLNEIWLLWLARLFNLGVYSLIIAFSLKIAPKLKMLLFFVAALPMSLQQAASCSPDALINSTAILLVAVFIYCYTKDNLMLSKKHMIAIGILCLIIPMAKVTNVFLIGIIFLIPNKRWSSRKGAVTYKLVIIGLAIIVAACFYMYTSKFSPNLEQAPYLNAMGVDSQKQLQYIFSHFSEWIKEFGNAIIYQTNDYINSLSVFGWLEQGYPILTAVMIFTYAKICFQEEGFFISKGKKIYIFLICVAIYTVTCLALYLTWSPVESEIILGVQGRYFIPLIAVIALMFVEPYSQRCNGVRSYESDMVIISGMAGAMMIMISNAYY